MLDFKSQYFRFNNGKNPLLINLSVCNSIKLFGNTIEIISGNNTHSIEFEAEEKASECFNQISSLVL